MTGPACSRSMRARAASVSAGSTISCTPLMPMMNEVRFSTAAGLSTELLVFAELALASDTGADSTVLELSAEARVDEEACP